MPKFGPKSKMTGFGKYHGTGPIQKSQPAVHGK
jgi:hypothetical protein